MTLSINEQSNELVHMIEHLMYGHNYQVTIGHEELNAKTIIDAMNELKMIYPEADTRTISDSTIDDVFDKIEIGFDYRGDDGAGLKIQPNVEINLKDLQCKYFLMIKKYINQNTKVYHLISCGGISGYPVFWDYRCYLINSNNPSCFIYGSSSD